jgi:hypothetical protein
MNRKFVRALAVGTAVVVVVTGAPATALAEPGPTDNAASAGKQGAIANPDGALGRSWRSSDDVLVAGSGDTDGFHLYVAREKSAFAWSTLATLKADLPEAGAWTGYVCLTGSGRYAAAVYAPAMAVNKPALLTAGAFAAVVDTGTGKSRMVATGVQLAYFNPSCGPDDQVLLTRSIGIEQRQTDLLTVDAAAGKVTKTRRIKAQLTNPAPARTADYGIVRGALVRVGDAGQLSTVGVPGGQPFAVHATAGGAVDLLTVHRQGDQDLAAAYRYSGSRQTRLGTAARTRLELYGLAGGRNAVVGDVAGINAAGLSEISLVHADRPVRTISREGHLLVHEMLTRQARISATSGGAPARPDAAGQLQVTVSAARTGQVSVGTVATTRKPTADMTTRSAVEPPPLSPLITDPACAVPRNDVFLQVLQPSANQVEWAVDQAVQGRLQVQQAFPLPAGAPRVPAQLMLAILAQESNLAQASWHAVPGDAGNPLVSDYYGNRDVGEIDYIDYGQADCGYGIAQVTDGMRRDSSTYTSGQRDAIATDYAANIAVGLRILIEKWNQTRATGTYVNNGDPRYIENWFMAVWGYNSGVYPNTGSGNYGVGWLNNPANPSYDASREPFLRSSLDDASHPADWPYPEKVMGWAETPQWQWIDPLVKYAEPVFGAASGGHLSLPGRFQFCGGPNQCSSSQPADPCPNWDSTCWWHGYTSWVEDCAQECGTERLTYAAGAARPQMLWVYPPACQPFRAALGTTTAVVDDLADSSVNLLGCAGQPRGGKFTLRPGYPPGTSFALYGDVDLHQLGAGYLGHSWFTHAYDGVPDDNYHGVVATWTPDLPSQDYEMVVHLASHGANIGAAEYKIYQDASNDVITCTINQDVSAGRDIWVSLGWTWLWPGARIELSNIVPGSDGTVDVGFDAIAFVDVPGYADGRECGDRYPT